MIYKMIEQLTFLEEGNFTKRDDVIKRLADRLIYSNSNILESISDYIRKELMYDPTKKSEIFRQRTASEIIKSCSVTGCTDVGLTFIAISRELGIPTKYVETFEDKWLLNTTEMISGHIFVDVRINDLWHAYEPLNGFTKDNMYITRFGKFVEVGKGLDFSELYLKYNDGYSTESVCLQSLSQMRKLVASLNYQK